jgi:hypothetical protein
MAHSGGLARSEVSVIHPQRSKLVSLKERNPRAEAHQVARQQSFEIMRVNLHNRPPVSTGTRTEMLQPRYHLVFPSLRHGVPLVRTKTGNLHARTH